MGCFFSVVKAGHVSVCYLCLSDGPRPSQTDIVELRFLMLEYVRQLVLRGSGVQDDELQSILNFLTTIHEVCHLVLLLFCLSQNSQLFSSYRLLLPFTTLVRLLSCKTRSASLPSWMTTEVTKPVFCGTEFCFFLHLF